MNRLLRRLPRALRARGGALPPGAARAATSEIVPAAGLKIDVGVNQGQLVRLARPVEQRVHRRPDHRRRAGQVAEARLCHRQGGRHDDALCRLRAGRGAAQCRGARALRCRPASQQAIRDLVPHSAIAVNAVDDSIVLTGTVYSAADGDDIRRIAARFVKDPKQLINKMKVDAPSQINLRVRVAEVVAHRRQAVRLQLAERIQQRHMSSSASRPACRR